jgi:hypothetical protein
VSERRDNEEVAALPDGELTQALDELARRFMTRVRKSAGCWEWLGKPIKGKGYGRMVVNGQTVRAHRLSYQLFTGPIPPGLCVLHECDNPICVRPDHLHVGTDLDNVRERCERGRSASGDRSGPRLHPEAMTRGEKHYAARLTAAAVRRLRRDRATGSTLMSLSRKYGISSTAVRKIVNRVTWKHV